MCGRFFESPFLLGSAPRKRGIPGAVSKGGGTSHEREQRRKAQRTRAVLLPDSSPSGQVLFVVLGFRTGRRRWTPSVREARFGGQARRADRVLGRDALSHRSLVQGGKT